MCVERDAADLQLDIVVRRGAAHHDGRVVRRRIEESTSRDEALLQRFVRIGDDVHGRLKHIPAPERTERCGLRRHGIGLCGTFPLHLDGRELIAVERPIRVGSCLLCGVGRGTDGHERRQNCCGQLFLSHMFQFLLCPRRRSAFHSTFPASKT